MPLLNVLLCITRPLRGCYCCSLRFMVINVGHLQLFYLLWNLFTQISRLLHMSLSTVLAEFSFVLLSRRQALRILFLWLAKYSSPESSFSCYLEMLIMIIWLNRYLSEQKLPRTMRQLQNGTDAGDCENIWSEDEGKDCMKRTLGSLGAFPYVIGDLQILNLGKLIEFCNAVFHPFLFPPFLLFIFLYVITSHTLSPHS